MNIKDNLLSLSNAVGLGNIYHAANIAFDIISKYTTATKNGLNIIGRLEGMGDYTLLLEAHIDEVGFIVTDIDSDGFLTVKNCGGIDLRALPARVVTIHGKREVTGVFCATPPHLAKGEQKYDDISTLKIDSLLGDTARDIISVGDFVSFKQEAVPMLNNQVTGKSLDNRAGVACLLETAKRLSGKELPFNVVFALTNEEELGHRGAKTAAFSACTDEALVLDVSFADGPDIAAKDCGRLSGGGMIGISPVLDKELSNKLADIAKENNIPYQLEVMGGATGTNSDVISISKSGVKTGLISIPLRNMHTDVETVCIDDLISVCDLLEQYVLGGALL
ncbi:MAG: M28 family peptidase [Clostridia bacterium]|nr:M28 family peptidase [Clostridia bacterium]